MKKEEVVSYIASGTVYEGKITFSGSLRVDGTIIGIVTGRIEKEPNVESLLQVGKCGRLVGKADVDKLSVEGTIEGDFRVSKRAEFIMGSKFKGKLFTPVLVVQERAIIEGSINVADEKVVEERSDIPDPSSYRKGSEA